MTASPLSLNQLFELLKDQRRRYVLYYLDDHDDTTISIDDLANQILEWELDWTDPPEQSLEEHRDDIKLALQHNHLPRIADSGIIDYDSRSKTIHNWDDTSLDALTDTNQAELTRIKHLLFPDTAP